MRAIELCRTAELGDHVEGCRSCGAIRVAYNSCRDRQELVLPRNFCMWTLPKGFFLIVRHHEGWEARAEELLDRVLTLITEYPDETIYGEAFVKGHRAQMQTVLAAYDALQAILAHESLVSSTGLARKSAG